MAESSRLAELESGSAAGSLTFRRADYDKDIEWLLGLDGRNENTGLIGQQDRTSHRAQIMDDPDVIYFVVETADDKTREEPRCAYCIIRGLVDPMRIIYLQRICVDLDRHRNTGVGMGLLLWIIHFAFESLSAHRLYLNCVDFNDRGKHVYEKAGEGHERAIGFDTRLDPETGVPLHDHKVRSGTWTFAMLREEYAALAGLDAETFGVVDPDLGPVSEHWEAVAAGEPLPLLRKLTTPAALAAKL